MEGRTWDLTAFIDGTTRSHGLAGGVYSTPRVWRCITPADQEAQRDTPQDSCAEKVVLSKKVTSGQAKELKSIIMTMNLSFILAYYRNTIGKRLPFLLGF